MGNYPTRSLSSILRGKVLKTFRPLMRAHWNEVTSKIPKYPLTNKHLSNAKLIANREELLKLLPKNAVVAELGVDKGGFSQKILATCTPKKLHLVDAWGSKRYGKSKQESVRNMFATQISNDLVEINLGLSTEVVDDFEDNYFDWIYLDTDHSYPVTIVELEAYRSKIKDGGIIAGHDYIVGNWNGMLRYGVIEAVHEFCSKYDWEIIYLTCELNINPSFAIKKIATSAAQ